MTEKAREGRPSIVYLVTHSYTCSHLSESERVTETIGAFYDEKNAILAAVGFIEEEFDVKFTDKDTWETDDGENGGTNNGNDDELGEAATIRDFLESREFSTEVETEGVDDHIVRLECLTMEDA